MTLQQLREKQAEIRSRITTMGQTLESRKAAHKTGTELLTAEERSQFEALKKEHKDLQAQIEAEERNAETLKWIEETNASEQRNRPTLDDPVPGYGGSTFGDLGHNRESAQRQMQAEIRSARAIVGWCKSQLGLPLTDLERTAAQETRTSLDQSGQINIPLMGTEELRSLRDAAGNWHGDERRARIRRHLGEMRHTNALSNTGEGTVLVPQVMVNAYEEAVLGYGGVLGIADVMTTADGSKMLWPTGDDTANEGSQIGEFQTAPGLSQNSVNPDFGSVSLGVYEYWSGFIRVQESTLRDSPLTLVAILGAMIGTRLAKAHNRKATVGTGTGQPFGVVTRAATGLTTAVRNTFTYVEAMKFKHSVASEYRANGQFMMNDDILLQYLLLLDGNNRPLLTEGTGVTPPTFLNRPFAINNHMPTAAELNTSGGAIMTYGDHKYMKCRFVGGLVLKRLVERFVELNQQGFVGFRGFDSNLLRWAPDATCPVKKMVMAAP